MSTTSGRDPIHPGRLHTVLVSGRDAAERAGVAAWQLADGVRVLRHTVRRMPLVMSLIMVGLGYVVGTVRAGVAIDTDSS